MALEIIDVLKKYKGYVVRMFDSGPAEYVVIDYHFDKGESSNTKAGINSEEEQQWKEA